MSRAGSFAFLSGSRKTERRTLDRMHQRLQFKPEPEQAHPSSIPRIGLGRNDAHEGLTVAVRLDGYL